MNEKENNIDLKEQMRIRLKMGAVSFNEWRKSNKKFRIDLANENFVNQNLSNYNFLAAKLKNCNFSGAILTGVDFRGANLNRANFADADLSGSNLRQARLVGANFRKAKLNGANLYATIKDEWVVSGVRCTNCWITKDRSKFPKDPDHFEEKEFEFLYGGFTIKIKFPGGFQPIDLLALPFYAERIQEEFKDKKLVFSGLKKSKESYLEFRVEEKPKKIEIKANDYFSHEVVEIRKLTRIHFSRIIAQKDDVIDEQRALLSTYKSLLKTPSKQVTNFINSPISLGDNYLVEQYNSYWNQIESNGERDKFREEILILLKEVSSSNANAIELIFKLKSAEDDVKKGEGDKAMKTISTIGNEIYDVAKKVGASLITTYLKIELGLD